MTLANTQKVIHNTQISTERWPMIAFPPINLWALPHTFKYSHEHKKHEITK
jgi:hypothetical protein